MRKKQTRKQRLANKRAYNKRYYHHHKLITKYHNTVTLNHILEIKAKHADKLNQKYHKLAKQYHSKVLSNSILKGNNVYQASVIKHLEAVDTPTKWIKAKLHKFIKK